MFRWLFEHDETRVRRQDYAKHIERLEEASEAGKRAILPSDKAAAESAIVDALRNIRRCAEKEPYLLW